MLLALYVPGAASDEAGAESEQKPSVLDASQHPPSPTRGGALFDDIVPLDAALSWIERFNGDETFNPESTEKFSAPTEPYDVPSASSQENKEDTAAADANGLIKSIRPEQGKIRIAHDPIDKYGMPPMTMVFQVEDPSLLSGLEKGQEIGFDVENTSKGFVVTRIVSLEEDQASGEGGMDARGTVKSVRLSQNKIRIAHDPIEKYGMPAMTMVFKVKDPKMLEGIEKGLRVEFDVENTPGGFEIVNIKPAE
jgi:Cu/Ag efflux protein CusF